MSKLTSHQKYTLYKHCLSLGVPDDIAVKIRERSHTPLETFLKYRDPGFPEVSDIVYSAFVWEDDDYEEGYNFWYNFLENFNNKGENK